MRPLVTVVIPAHNPGHYIEPCIRSLLRQTLARDRFEVVFVDDGSTDGTGARLDRFAREQPHVRVIHIPASGAPGRPRNIGIEAALGEYIQFLDADDELAPRALQRLLAMARANRSDIVLGKFASETQARRQDLFTRNRSATTLRDLPQLADASMGPTKLFRAGLLREHEISFPEGWRQMEDQVFTLRAYLAADVISILGDEPCYFFNKREDEGHISSELVDPSTHAAHLTEILDELDAVADPDFRRRFIARFYRVEVLGRVAGQQFVDAGPRYRAELVEALRPLARDRFSAGVDTLGAVARVRSQLLLDGAAEDLRRLAERTAEYAVDGRVTSATWSSGRLRITYRARLAEKRGGRRLEIVRRGAQTFLHPAVAEDLVGPVDVTEELGTIRIQVSLVDRETALEWIVPGTTSLAFEAEHDDGQAVPTVRGVVNVDTERVGPGDVALDDGAWHVQLRWSGLGFRTVGLLRVPIDRQTATPAAIRPALVGEPPRWVVPRADAGAILKIGVGSMDRTPADMSGLAGRVIHQGHSLAIELPVATNRRGLLARGALVLAGPRGTHALEATYVGALGSVVAKADIPAAANVARGSYELTAHIGERSAPAVPVARVIVNDKGAVTVLGLASTKGVSRAAAQATWTARLARTEALRRTRTVFRQLPDPVRESMRQLAGRLRG